MEQSKQFVIQSNEEVEVLDESALKGAAGGATFTSFPKLELVADRYISPIRLRPIDLVMGKTTLF